MRQLPSNLCQYFFAIQMLLFLTSCQLGGERPTDALPTVVHNPKQIRMQPIEPSESDVIDPQGNLLSNASFEEVVAKDETASGGDLKYWSTSGDISLDFNHVISGRYAVRGYAQDGTSSISSELFAVKPHSRVEFSGMIRAQNVVSSGSYHKLRITLAAYESDQKTKIQHWDLISTSGSFEWQRVQDSIIVPEDTHYMRLALSLTKSSGTFWADDLAVVVVQEPIEQYDDLVGGMLSAPGGLPDELVPQPWQIITNGDTYPIGQVGVLLEKQDKNNLQILTEIEEFLSLKAIDYQIVGETLNEAAVRDYVLEYSEIDTWLLIGDQDNEVIGQDPTLESMGTSWSSLGEEGYFLSIRPVMFDDLPGSVATTLIAIGADHSRGQFYGIQTLKQLIDADLKIRAITLVDKPTAAHRGVPVGLQWYRESELLVDRLAAFKFNFVWVQGTFEDQLLWYRWREPLPESSKENIRHFVDLVQDHHITPFISIGPRGEDLTGATVYSSEDNIDATVGKMEELYELGVRHFGLSFDDLVNVGQDVLSGQDVTTFEHIGEAHAYFVEQVYHRLNAQHDDIEMMIVPMVYDGLGHLSSVEENYLSALGMLPKEIGFYSGIVYPQDAVAALRLTGRKHLVWDNFWASFYSLENPATNAVLPLQRSLRENDIVGYTFMPIVPKAEDALLVSWRSAADFAWSPSRYGNEELQGH